MLAVGLSEVRIRGFRSARDVAFAPGPLCALVGEASVGKSTLLGAVRALLDRDAPPLGPEDASPGGDGRIRIEGRIGRRAIAAEWPPQRGRRHRVPPVLFLPSELRSGSLMASIEPRGEASERTLAFFRSVLDRRSAGAPALSFLRAVERCCEDGVRGLVVLIEEPELFLRPQAQRYLYRLLRALSACGNQVLYTTHSPAFLNVARLDELAIVVHDEELGTQVRQPQPIAPDEDFRALSAFDAERSELFLARAALLVEGRTEKVVFPFVFEALGYDVDREAVSIVECGGKSNIPLVAAICRAVGVPFVVVHDRDAGPGTVPIQAEQAVNQRIAEVAGPVGAIVLEPDFEAVVGLSGHSHKPEHAWRRFASLGGSEMPEPLVRAARHVVELARS